MEYLPIFVDLRNKNILVIGDYRVLEFKIKKMIEAGARIIYLTDLQPEQINDIAKSKNVTLVQDQFNESYLKDKWLVVCGSNNPELKKRIAELTHHRNIFCNFVDEAPLSSFISPTVVSKGDITIAISTGGKSPALNKHLKNKIKNSIGDEYSTFVNLLGKVRKKVIKNIPGQNIRSDLFDRIVQKQEIIELIKDNRISEAENIIEQIVDEEISRIHNS